MPSRICNCNCEQDLRIFLPWRRMAQDGAKKGLRLAFRPHSRFSARGSGWPADPRFEGQRIDNVCLVIVAAHFNPHGGPGGAIAQWIHRAASSQSPQKRRWGKPGAEPCPHRTTWSTSYIMRHPCNSKTTSSGPKSAHPQASAALKHSPRFPDVRTTSSGCLPILRLTPLSAPSPRTAPKPPPPPATPTNGPG